MKLREYLSEAKVSIDIIKKAVENSSSFMNVGKELKKANIKYDFSTSPMPIYMIKSGSEKYAIVNKKYADPSGDDVIIGDIVIGKM